MVCVCARALLAPIITRFHKLSPVDKSSRVHPCKIAGRFNDRVKRDREGFPKSLLHVDNFARYLSPTVIGSESWVKVHIIEIVDRLAITIFFYCLASPDATAGFRIHAAMKESWDIFPDGNRLVLLVFKIENERTVINLTFKRSYSSSNLIDHIDSNMDSKVFFKWLNVCTMCKRFGPEDTITWDFFAQG